MITWRSVAASHKQMIVDGDYINDGLELFNEGAWVHWMNELVMNNVGLWFMMVNDVG